MAGGIPTILKALREALPGNTDFAPLRHPERDLHDYTLIPAWRLEGLSFADCLKDAQRLGYAEADPAFDVEGYRYGAQAGSILTTSCLRQPRSTADDNLRGGHFRHHAARGYAMAAAELGYPHQAAGRRTSAPKTGIEQRVHPTMVPVNSVIAQVDGVTNAVAIESDILGELLMVGPGAGGNATASSVLGGIADIAKSQPVGAQRVPVLGHPAKASKIPTARPG